MATGDGSPSVTRHRTKSHDATERRRAEKALERERQILQIIVDNIPVMVAFFDPTGTVQMLNREAESVLGWSVEELAGRDLLAQCYPDPEYRQSVVDYMLSASPGWREFETRARDGRIVFTSWVNVRLPDGSGIGIGQDLTEHKRAEEALHVAREELEGRVERQMLRRNPYGLTFRELTVLHLVAAGRTDKEIGLDLGISPLTAHKHLSNILAKMSVASRTEAVARALREGLLD